MDKTEKQTISGADVGELTLDPHADLKARLAAHAAAHVATQDAIEQLRPTAEIQKLAEDHAATYFAGLLDDGRPVNEAMAAAVEEATRHAAHLRATAALHAGEGTFADLACAACETVTKHAVVTHPETGEVTATCLCGRFRKFAKGAPVADVEPEPEWFEGKSEEEIAALNAERTAERLAEEAAAAVAKDIEKDIPF